MSSTEESNLNQKTLKRGVRHALVLVVPVCILLLGLLVGCQLQDMLLATPTTIAQPTINQLSDSTPNPQTTEAVSTPTKTQIKLVIWVPPSFDPDSGSKAAELFKKRIAAFVAIHSEVVIEVRVKSLDGRGGLLDSIATASSAAPKALPSLVLLSSQDLENATLKELLLPLDNVYKGFADNDWLPYASQMPLVENINYGVPIAGDALVMAYWPLQSPFPPSTWQELALQDLVVAFPAADEDALTITSIYLAANGKLVGETGTPILQSSPLLKAYAIINDGTQTGAFPYWLSQFTGFDQSWQAFTNHQAGYSIIWASQYFQNRLPNTSINMMPKVGNNQVNLACGWVWAIPSQATNQPYSVELLNYFSDPEFVNAWDQASGYLPVRESGVDLWQNDALASTIEELVHTAQNIPSGAITHITNPILESSLVQVIKKQVFYQQAVDDAIKNFTQ